MGKGFNNYMCKKFFHPASADNLKRVWIAQKKSDAEKKKQDDLRAQYDREQELYQNKALLSKESKERLELNFMYEPPPGVKKIGEGDKDEEGEPEYKFEWQRTWGHAPKESYLEKGDDFNEQPFGIQVCQAKCIKCGKYGHMNTDKRCPLYGKSIDHDAPIQNVDQNKLIQEMKAEGLAMRYTAWDMKREIGPNHTMVEEERGVDRVELLKTMSKEEKKKLLKKLKKMEKKQKKKDKKDKKEKKKSSSSNSDSDEWEERTPATRRSPSPDRRKRSSSGERKEKRRDRADDHGARRRDRSSERKDRKRDRSRSREVKRERSRDKDRRRDRSMSRDRKKDRSMSRERRRDRSVSRDRRRDRPTGRDDRRDDRRRERS